MSKSTDGELLKKKDNVYFLGTSRDKNMNRFVFVFKTDNDLNVVNDSIELFQILAIDIPLKFIEQANIEVVINDEEIEVVDFVFDQPIVAKQNIIEYEDYEEEIPLQSKKNNNVPEPPKAQEETGSLSRLFKNLDVESYGRGHRKKK